MLSPAAAFNPAGYSAFAFPFETDKVRCLDLSYSCLLKGIHPPPPGHGSGTLNKHDEPAEGTGI